MHKHRLVSSSHSPREEVARRGTGVWSGGVGPGGEETPPRPQRRRQGEGNLCEEPAPRPLPAYPAPGGRQRSPRQRRPRRREKRNPRVLGGSTRSPAQRTIPGPRPTPVARACLRAHTPTPRARCLPGAGSASGAGPRGSSAASLRLRPPPLPPLRPPPPALLPIAAAPPPDLPASRRRRGAGADEARACRCPARGGSGAGRSARLSSGPHSVYGARGDMSVATGSSEAAGGAGGGGGGARVFFQSPLGSAGGSPGSSSGSGSSREDSAPVATASAAGHVQQQQRRHQQGKVTVKYDRKELRRRLVVEEWIVEQLVQLYGCEVPGRGAGRVGGLAGPAAQTQEFSRALAPRRAPPWLLGTQGWERGAACSLSRVPSGAGAQRWRRPSWVHLLGSRRAGGPLDGRAEGWVLLGALRFCQPWALLGSSCSSPKWGSEGITPAARKPTGTALTAGTLADPVFVEGEQGKD